MTQQTQNIVGIGVGAATAYITWRYFPKKPFLAIGLGALAGFLASQFNSVNTITTTVY